MFSFHENVKRLNQNLIQSNAPYLKAESPRLSIEVEAKIERAKDKLDKPLKTISSLP